MRRPVVSGVLALCAVACHSSGTAPAFYVNVAGTYQGSAVNGAAVSWLLSQTADSVVTGAGSYQPPGSAATPFQIRGAVHGPNIQLRLVGAPGDAPGDSLVWSGRYDTEYYTKSVLAGGVSGGVSSPLDGALTMYISS